MILNLNNKKLMLTGVAGLMIYSAVVLKNGSEQIGKKNHPIPSILGRALFVGGWGLMAYAISGKPSMKMSQKSLMAYGGSLGVVIAVMAMKSLPLSAAQKKPFGMLFIASWILVASSVGMGKSMRSKQLGMLALANVLGSMLYILPKQRELGIVDGPGMGMFSLTFVSLALANAL